MKRKKECSIIDLSTLYLSYIFNKITLIVFLVAIIFIVLALLFLANPNLDMEEYILNPTSFHQNYFVQSLFILQIFNGIIIQTLVILLSIQSNSFDALFIGRMKRIRITISKTITIITILFLLSLFEFFVLYLYPVLIFKDYKLEIQDLDVIFFLFLSSLFLYSLSNLLCNLIQSIFVPMTVLFLDLAKGIISSSFKDMNKILSYILPILNYEKGHIYLNSIMVSILFILFFIVLYIFIYNIKDIKIL